MQTMPPPSGRRDPDVLVIGGGIVGLFSAYFLRRCGLSVAVLERGEVGGEQSCSSGNTGFVGTQGSVPLAEPGVPALGLRYLLNPESPFYIRPRPDPALAAWLWHFWRACTEQRAQAGFTVLHELKSHSLDILRTLCADGDLADTFTTPGIVLACRTRKGFDKAAASVPRMVEHGVPLRVLDQAELRTLEPDVEYDVAGALYNAEGAALHTPTFLHRFARRLTAMGVDLHPGTEVLDFDTGGGRVRTVRTNAGDFTPGEVVLAAGVWSDACARRLGARLALQPAKGYSVTLATPRRAPRIPALLTEGKVALMPLGERVRLSGTLELSGLRGDLAARRIDGILRTARTYLPDLSGTTVVHTWSGLRPCTPDGLPSIGRTGPCDNVSVATGGGHVGMGLAPATGRLVAQIVTGERPDTDLAPLDPGRYHGWVHRTPRPLATVG